MRDLVCSSQPVAEAAILTGNQVCCFPGKPQRMNGKVSGRVFVGNSPSAVELSNNDLHSYMVVNDGRASVAISNIPDALGPSMLPLTPLGGVIGWAFALEQPGHRNGFSLIGKLPLCCSSSARGRELRFLTLGRALSPASTQADGFPGRPR